jgi:Protein of unknown function (DUF3485)
MNPFLAATRRALRQPGFLVAFVVLLTAAVGLNAATSFLRLHFKKLPVPPRREIYLLPETLGPWVSVLQDEISDEVQQELATNRYVFRYYVNSDVVSRLDLDLRFHQKDNKERQTALFELRKDPKYAAVMDQAVVSCAVTYYTGKADTVAHIPDRCYVADGYVPTTYKKEDWFVNTPLTGDGTVPVRYISFEDSESGGSARGNVTKNVAYFFHVNGHYTDDPKQVRISLQNLWEKYGYYAKVELMVQSPGRDKDAEFAQAAQVMKSFLLHAMPEIEKSLPVWPPQ